MGFDDIIEKIKRIENGNSGNNNIVYFIVAFDLLYFLKDEDNRSRFIREYYKNDNKMFAENLKKICIYCESILLEDSTYHKILKQIEMDVKREDLVSTYLYFDTIDRIEKENQSPRDMLSDSFKIRLLHNTFDKSTKDYKELNDKVVELKDRYNRNMIDIVTIIAIFVAIVIGMVSGISFSLQAFANVTSNNLKVIMLTCSVVGFVIFNLIYIILKFVSRLINKDIDKKGYIIYIEIIFVALIIFFSLISI
jgi:hypothetical protein